MLAEKYQELLTAYVDGELSARQRRAVYKLLRRSAEARALLRQLQEDSHSLIELPPPPPAPDFAGSVMLSNTPEKSPKPQPKDPPSDLVKAPEKKPDPQKPDLPEKKPDPQEPGAIVTAPTSMEVFQPGSAEVALPTLLRLRDLGQEMTQKKL